MACRQNELRRRKDRYQPDGGCRASQGVIMTVSKKMSVSQARLGIGAPMRMKRVQTQCGVELLDCGVTATKPELAPTVPMSCDDEVWVQLDRAHEKSIAFLDLACHLGERVSGHRKHRRIVRVKLDRPPRQP